MKIKIGNKTKIKFVKDRPGHDFRYALDNTKIYNFTLPCPTGCDPQSALF